MSWKCHACGVEHDDIPLCFGIEAPWRALVPESEFAQRVDLTPDQCVVDEETFFVRGHIEIPIYAATATTPWGVVMETGFPEGSFTLVAISDGNASIYLSSGGGSIGGGGHETIRKASQAMVTLAASYRPQAAATKEFPLPKDGQTIFYLLTDAGVFTASAPEQDLGEERHAWSALFHAGHQVIGQYRLIEQTLK